MLAGFLFGSFLDGVEMVGPEVLKRLDPVVHWFELQRVKCVETLLTIFFHGNKPYLSEDTEVLRDGGLWNAQEFDEIVHGVVFGLGEDLDDLTAARFGEGGEGVGGCGERRHMGVLYSNYGIYQGKSVQILGAIFNHQGTEAPRVPTILAALMSG